MCLYWICLISFSFPVLGLIFLNHNIFSLTHVISLLCFKAKLFQPPPPLQTFSPYCCWKGTDLYCFCTMLYADDSHLPPRPPPLLRWGAVHGADGRLLGSRLCDLQEHGRSLHNEDGDRPEAVTRYCSTLPSNRCWT